MPALPAQHTAEKDASLVCRVHWWQASKLEVGEGQAVSDWGLERENGGELSFSTSTHP